MQDILLYAETLLISLAWGAAGYLFFKRILGAELKVLKLIIFAAGYSIFSFGLFTLGIDMLLRLFILIPVMSIFLCVISDRKFHSICVAFIAFVTSVSLGLCSLNFVGFIGDFIFEDNHNYLIGSFVSLIPFALLCLWAYNVRPVKSQLGHLSNGYLLQVKENLYILIEGASIFFTLLLFAFVVLSRFDVEGLYFVSNICFVFFSILAVKGIAVKTVEPFELSETYLSTASLLDYEQARMVENPTVKIEDIIDLYPDEWVRKYEYENGIRQDVKLGWIKFTIVRDHEKH